MAEPKTKKRKKARRVARERRFEPSAGQSSKLVLGVGMVGALVLGAGVYSQWIRDEPQTWAPYLVGAGALLLAGALWFGETTALPVRVGDMGVAIERGNDLGRLVWCEIEEISIRGKELALRGEDLTLSVALDSHPTAIAWILDEAERRIPDAVNVDRADRKALPKPREADGEAVELDGLELAASECAASGEAITFERDARICPNCGEVYHRDHMPKRCVTCDAMLGTKALRV